MPAALGHPGRCLASIGLRFTHARRNAAPRTVPHGPRPDGAGPTAAPIARTPARQAHGTPAAHPIAAAGACRGCCPAAVTLCANRAALARAFIYNLFAIANRCGEHRFFWGPNLGARSGAHGRAMSCGFVAGSCPTARPCGCGRVGCGCVGTWPQQVMARRCARVRERRERWHGVCVRGLGSGYNSPSPPARHLRASRLAGSKHCVHVFGIAVFGSPTCLSCYRFYGHFVGVYPSAQKHVVNRWSLCRIAPRFRLVKCGGRCPQSLRVPRVLVCSSRQLYRQPAPRRPLPRRGYN